MMSIAAKRTIILFYVSAFIIILSGCKSEGKYDLPLFIKSFNENYGEEKIKEENMLIHDNTFYFFLPSGSPSAGEILLTVSENKNKEIYECGISVIRDVKTDTDEFKKIFSSTFCSMTNKDEKKAEEILESLSPDEINTYTKGKNIIKSADKYKVDLISNEAGTGVYIYRASE